MLLVHAFLLVGPHTPWLLFCCSMSPRETSLLLLLLLELLLSLQVSLFFSVVFLSVERLARGTACWRNDSLFLSAGKGAFCSCLILDFHPSWGAAACVWRRLGRKLTLALPTSALPMRVRRPSTRGLFAAGWVAFFLLPVANK